MNGETSMHHESKHCISKLPPTHTHTLSPSFTLCLRRAACEQWIMNLWLLNSYSNCRQMYLISERRSQQCMNWLPAPTVWMLITTVFRKRGEKKKTASIANMFHKRSRDKGRGHGGKCAGREWQKRWQRGNDKKERWKKIKMPWRAPMTKFYCRLKRRG